MRLTLHYYDHDGKEFNDSLLSRSGQYGTTVPWVPLWVGAAVGAIISMLQWLKSGSGGLSPPYSAELWCRFFRRRRMKPKFSQVLMSFNHGVEALSRVRGMA